MAVVLVVAVKVMAVVAGKVFSVLDPVEMDATSFATVTPHFRHPLLLGRFCQHLAPLVPSSFLDASLCCSSSLQLQLHKRELDHHKGQ